jgi:hypothetical protein
VLAEDRPNAPALAPHVDRAFDGCRTRPAGAHRADRACDFARRFRRATEVRVGIDQPFDDSGLIADLMQVAEALADRALRNLPDHRQHRRIHAVGREQRGS